MRFGILVLLMGFASQSLGAVVDQIDCHVTLTTADGQSTSSVIKADMVRKPVISTDPSVKITESNLVGKVGLGDNAAWGVFRLNFAHATQIGVENPRSAQVACMTGIIFMGEPEFEPFGCPDWIKSNPFGEDTYWASTTSTNGVVDFAKEALYPTEVKMNDGSATMKVDCSYLGTESLRRSRQR